MTETVTVSNVIAIASLVSEIWLVTERQTDGQTDTHRHTLRLSTLTFVNKTHTHTHTHKMCQEQILDVLRPSQS